MAPRRKINAEYLTSRIMRGHLGGQATPKRWRPSPTKKVAGHIFHQLRRPSRIRGRFLLLVVTLTGLFFLHFGRYNADGIQRKAFSLGAYVPIQLTAAFVHDQEIEAMRWDDSQDPNLKNQSTSIKKSTFHLLIPASKPSLGLCKTLLSASILNYPPPTLIGYGVGEDRDRPGTDVIRKTLQFLDGDSVHDDDLVLVVDDDTVFQLPAEVLITRFFHIILSSTSSLLDKFGRMPGNFTTLSSQCPQRYYTNVLFAAQQNCTSSPSSPECYLAPQSPILKGPFDLWSRHELQHKRPRYINSAMMMGTVRHLRPIYKRAQELVETDGRNGTQNIFSMIFGGQECHRELYQSTLSSLAKASQWIASKLPNHLPHNLFDHSSNLNNSTARKSSEFGIGLDYTSSIFQIIDSSSKIDIQFVKFSNLSESLNISRKQISKIHLPQDLNFTAPPFALHCPTNDPLSDHDTLPQNLSWSSVPLLTNTFIPSSPTVPSTLKINLNNPNSSDPSFSLWYEPHARALLRQSLLLSTNPIAIVTLLTLPSIQSAKLKATLLKPAQDLQYIDLRGGRGGVWTDKGEWLGWNEVCGPFDEEVFADGKGAFNVEDGDDGKGG